MSLAGRHSEALYLLGDATYTAIVSMAAKNIKSFAKGASRQAIKNYVEATYYLTAPSMQIRAAQAEKTKVVVVVVVVVCIKGVCVCVCVCRCVRLRCLTWRPGTSR